MHFLIVKMSAFGDIVHSYPVLAFLKECFPDCKIDWVVEKRMAQLVSSHPFIDRVIPVDFNGFKKNISNRRQLKEFCSALSHLRQTKYDALFDLQGNCKSAFVSFLARAKHKVGFGFKTASEWLHPFVMTHRYNPPAGLNVRYESLYLVEQYLGKKVQVINGAVSLELDDASVVTSYQNGSWLICPGSNWPNKKLTEKTLIGFLQQIQQKYNAKFVFLCGTVDEKREAERLVAAFTGATILEKPSLSALQHIMALSKVVISMDSLPLHLAATSSTPTFSIFGPSSSQKYGPLGLQHAVFQGSCPYGKTFERRCPILRTCSTGACMHNIDSNELFDRFSQFYDDGVATRSVGD